MCRYQLLITEVYNNSLLGHRAFVGRRFILSNENSPGKSIIELLWTKEVSYITQQLTSYVTEICERGGTPILIRRSPEGYRRTFQGVKIRGFVPLAVFKYKILKYRL